MLARHWVRLPHADCEALARLARNLRPLQEGLAPRNEERLAQLNEPRRLDMVLLLPDTLAARVRRAGPPTVTLAQNFQTAVVVELFLMTGLRIANVAELEIGRTLLLRENGGIDILIPRESVKNLYTLYRRSAAAGCAPPTGVCSGATARCWAMRPRHGSFLGLALALTSPRPLCAHR